MTEEGTIKIYASVLYAILLFHSALAQPSHSVPVYNVCPKVELPLSLGLFAYNGVGFKLISEKPPLDSTQIVSLNRNDLWPIDRVATRQDVAFRDQAGVLSDAGLYLSVALPFALAIDPHIRKDWRDVLVLFAETHAINSAIYIMAAGAFDRNRPFLYHPDMPMQKKTGRSTRISFFSGHVSTAAASTFFTAKVISDYYPKLTKKYWLFAAAALPPAFVGYYRVKALNHFPTDVLTGLVVGASLGILVPHLHKNKTQNGKLSVSPFTGQAVGLNIHYSFN